MFDTRETNESPLRISRRTIISDEIIDGQLCNPNTSQTIIHDDIIDGQLSTTNELQTVQDSHVQNGPNPMEDLKTSTKIDNTIETQQVKSDDSTYEARINNEKNTTTLSETQVVENVVTNRNRYLNQDVEKKRRLAISANIARKIAMQRDKDEAQAVICSLTIGMVFSVAVFIIVMIHTLYMSGQLFSPIKSTADFSRRKTKRNDLSGLKEKSMKQETTQWTFPSEIQHTSPVHSESVHTSTTTALESAEVLPLSSDLLTASSLLSTHEILGPQLSKSVLEEPSKSIATKLTVNPFYVFPVELSMCYANGQLLSQSPVGVQESLFSPKEKSQDGQVRFAAPHLPRSALTLENAGWGNFHAPLPPSWALVQASASLISGHTPADRTMLGDLLGNSYSLEEIIVDELSPSSQPSFAFLARAAAQEHASSTASSPLDVAKVLFPPRVEELLPLRLPGEEEEEEGEEEHLLDKTRENSVFSRPSLSHPPARQRMFSVNSGNSSAIRQDDVQLLLVKQLAQSTWEAYKKYAWGKDALKPISLVGEDSFGGVCMMIVDSLDTLLILGMRDDFDIAVEYVIKHLNLTEQEDVNLFESTIRVIGGLLAAYELDNRRDVRLLQKAAHVADALSIGFDSPSGIPYGTIGLRTKRKYNPTWVSGSTVAEVATLTLEWEHLSFLTGDPKYALWVRRAMSSLLLSEVTTDSLFPTYLNPESGDFSVQHVTLGARGDSSYEYLLKPYLLAGGMRDTRKWAVRSSAGDNTLIEFPGLVGNTALLSASLRQALTTTSYAPPGNSIAGIVWRACSATIQQFSSSLPQSTSSSYAESIAAYEVRSRRMLDNAQASRASTYTTRKVSAVSRTDYCNDDINVDNDGFRDFSVCNGVNPPHKNRTSKYLPPFHPTAFMHPQFAQITQASEASWFTAFFGFHLRSLAGIEHQLVRITQPTLQSPSSPASQACVLSTTRGTPLPMGASCIGSTATGEGGRYSYVVERNGDSRLNAASPQDTITASVAETLKAAKEAKNAAAVAMESYKAAHFLFKSLRKSINENRSDEELLKKLESTTVIFEEAVGHARRAIEVFDQATKAASAALKLSSTAPPAPPPAFTYDPKVDHLVCFLPGHLALSSTVAPTRGLRRRHLALAKRLMRTCMRMYSVTNSGIAAEIYRAGPPTDSESGLLPDAGARHSLLRPETVESLFLLYRITGEQIYRDWGAQILSSFLKHARVPNGQHVASVSDVTGGGGTTATPLSDSLESFFFAETLKYLFLLFSEPDVIPLDEWVFNTEAHPFRVWPASSLQG
jgi:hypothetical protein